MIETSPHYFFDSFTITQVDRKSKGTTPCRNLNISLTFVTLIHQKMGFGFVKEK